MSKEIVTNIKWYLATEKLPGNNVHRVLVCTPSGMITSMAVYKGHFNCNFKEAIGKDYEFKAGEDVIYWAHCPRKLINAWNKYTEMNSKW